MSDQEPITLANVRRWYSELDDPDLQRMASYNLGARWRDVIGFLLPLLDMPGNGKEG